MREGRMMNERIQKKEEEGRTYGQVFMSGGRGVDCAKVVG
jgi:hypothetical protein